MAYDFPSNPANGQTYNGYVWNGYAWVPPVAAVSGSVTTIADTPPANPAQGQTWWESDTGGHFINYDDGTSQQWVQLNESIGPALAGMVPTTRQILGASLATGGGDLSANRTITVAETSQAEAQAGTGANGAMTARRFTDALRIIYPDITPWQYGATGSDPIADMAAVTAAFQDAVALKRPVLLRGTLFFSAPQASTYNFANRDATHSIHVCVKMLSGLQVYGRDARIRVKPPTTWTQGPNQRAVLFGTDRNMTPGTISDVLFDDITFDFNHEFGAVHSYTYAFNAIGVDKLQRRNLKILSSGNRVGRGLWTENCRYRKDINIHHQNITQGGYLRYDDDQTWHNLSFDTFTEAIDIDSMCNRVSGSGLRFRNGQSEAQCLDLSGVRDITLSDIQAQACGAIMFLYDKPDNWPTYAEWLANEGVVTSTAVTSRDVSLSGVKATAMLNVADSTLMIGNYRDSTSHPGWEGYDPPAYVTLRDIDIEGGNRVAVHECLDLKIDGLRLRNMSPGVSNREGAALVLQQSTHDTAATAGARLVGSVRDVLVENSQGMGVIVNAPENLDLDGITVRGYNLQGNAATNLGVSIERSGIKGGMRRIGRVSVEGGPANATDLRILETTGSEALYRYSLEGPFALKSTAVGTVNCDVRVGPSLMRRTVIPLDRADLTTATGLASKIYPLVHDTLNYHRLIYAAIINASAITGNLNNYILARLRLSVAGTATSVSGAAINLDNVSRVADQETPFPFTVNAPQTLIDPGSTLHLDLSRTGTGSVQAGLAVVVVTVPYTKV